jgi:hypothetical protein
MRFMGYYQANKCLHYGNSKDKERGKCTENLFHEMIGKIVKNFPNLQIYKESQMQEARRTANLILLKLIFIKIHYSQNFKSTIQKENLKNSKKKESGHI